MAIQYVNETSQVITLLMKNEISAYDITKNDLVGIKQILEDPQYYIDKYRNLSSELIWNESIVSEVKNQGRCGSCWAFSTTGAIEANMRINNYSIDITIELVLLCYSCCFFPF